MPQLILYRANWACSLVPHAILLHYSIPFTAVVMKPGPHGYEAADGSLSNSQYRAIHHAGYVPALAVDGEVVTELPAILSYVASLVHDTPLLGTTAMCRAKVLEWMAWLSGTLHGNAFAMLRRPDRFSDDPAAHQGIRDKGRALLEQCYGRIDTRLAEQEFAVGDELTVVDFTLYIHWQWALELLLPMKDTCPSYARLMSRMEKMDGIQRAVKAEGMPLTF